MERNPSERAGDLVRLLDIDPDLSEGLDSARAADAREVAIARTATVPKGPWQMPRAVDAMPAGNLGLLILEGVFVRAQHIGKQAAAELLGAGDLLRPWLRGDELSSLQSDPSWVVLSPARVALLDRAFVAALAPWPEIVAALFERSVSRSRLLAFQLAINHVRRVDARLLLLLWRLADRWGRVHSDGVVLPLPLTHEWLARLVGAQRPSVTTALKRLADRDQVLREPDGAWLLRGDPPDLSEAAAEDAAGAPG